MGDKIVKSKNLCCQPVVLPILSLLTNVSEYLGKTAVLQITPLTWACDYDFFKSIPSISSILGISSCNINTHCHCVSQVHNFSLKPTITSTKN